MLSKIYITGLPGSGREGVAGRLARSLGWELVSIDKEVEREHGEGPEELKRKRGEEFSQTAQLEALKRTGTLRNAVISVSTDVVTRAEAWRVMNSQGSLSVFLDASARALARRLSGSPDPPPELIRSLSALARARRPFCEERAHKSIRVDRYSEGEVVTLILWAMPPAYKEVARGVLVGRGVILDLPAIVRDRFGEGKGFVVADKGSWGFAGREIAQALKGTGGLSVFMVDEGAVKADGVLDLWLKMSRGRADSGSYIVSIGRKASHSLALTAGASYLGGLGVLVVPTDPLSALDECAVGGCFLKLRGRRLIGSGKKPELLLVDTALLPSQGSRHLLAEAVKLGAVASADIIELVSQRKGELLSGHLEAYQALLEAGIPANFSAGPLGLFGHTVAWALEESRKISHGEAVAFGMLWEAEKLGAPEEVKKGIREALEAVGINPNLDIDSTRLRAFVNSTKLTRGGKALAVQVKELGKGELVEVEGF